MLRSRRLGIGGLVVALGLAVAACSGSSGFNSTDTLSAAVHNSIQQRLDHPTSGQSSSGARVTSVACTRNGRSNSFTCRVGLNNGTTRSVTAIVPANGRSFAIQPSQF
jgi:hypothetical protein